MGVTVWYCRDCRAMFYMRDDPGLRALPPDHVWYHSR